MKDETARLFRKFMNSPVGKKLLASKIIDEVDPQYLLENYLSIAFKAGRDSVDPPAEDPKFPTIDPNEVIRVYNETFMRAILPVPQRIETVLGRIADARRTKFKLELHHFKTMFEFKRRQAEGKDEVWLEFETLCARKHFFKYLEQSKQEFTKGPQTKVNQKLF
jgi:hypothetical protein